MSDNFIVGKRRRKIEDSIISRFRKINFKQKNHAYLEDDDFWDFVFSWYELVKYYEDVRDTAIGAQMLDLYRECRQVFTSVASDKKLHERRRDKASDAIYQMTYYVDRMLNQAERNGIKNEAEQREGIGDLSWAKQDDDRQDDISSMN